MADPDEPDLHKNNLGYKLDPRNTDYDTWDWRQIQASITGSVNTDLNTAAQKLPEVSDPQSLYTSANNYGTGSTNLNLVHDGLKAQTDLIVGVDNPRWTGPAADSFKGLMAKTLAAVKTHAAPLEGPPSYLATLYSAGNALSYAINDVNTKNYNAALAVINRWNSTPAEPGTTTGTVDFTYSDGGAEKGPPPWYDYNGTTIVMISRYPDIDHQLTLDMRKSINTLVSNYRTSGTDMAAPTGVLPTMPAANKDPAPIKIDIPNPKLPKPPKQPKQQPPPKPPDPQKGPGAPDLKNGADAPGGAGDAPLGPDGQPLGPDGQPLGPDDQVPGPDDQALTDPGAGPDAPDLAPPDGQQLGPDGQPLGPDGQQLGPDGQQLGPGGKPLVGTGPDAPGLVTPGGADGNGLTRPGLVDTPNGPALVGPDGRTLLDPKTGKPLTGPDGKPLTVGDLKKPALTPPGGIGAPPGFKPVDLTHQPLPKFSPSTLANLEKAGVKPPNLANLVGGGAPARPGALASEGAVKPGAREFGAPGEAAAGGRAAAGEGGREPMPMGGGGMGGGGAGGEKDRDRTTWLVEDEEVWGAETALGLGVLGR
ncbi:hypothetical protein [Actinomadura sp. DC4]|uniref:hypothetical protein n=1 Tax=Actinomadura sp. DC4 TaxID=3055069 RepID=UPI0025B17ED4|nr:hypothetical protein [Actinomadura sp. DC4]MDN3354766.1 hypothetical protein [Actinomadura sp. DC4]